MYDYITISSDECHLIDYTTINPKKYRSTKAKRGPFQKNDWYQNADSSDPMMTCYKNVSVECKIFGLQNKLESLILNQYRQMLLGFHQQLWCWTDEWIDLSLEDVQNLEKTAKLELSGT